MRLLRTHRDTRIVASIVLTRGKTSAPRPPNWKVISWFPLDINFAVQRLHLLRYRAGVQLVLQEANAARASALESWDIIFSARITRDRVEKARRIESAPESQTRRTNCRANFRPTSSWSTPRSWCIGTTYKVALCAAQFEDYPVEQPLPRTAKLRPRIRRCSRMHSQVDYIEC